MSDEKFTKQSKFLAEMTGICLFSFIITPALSFIGGINPFADTSSLIVFGALMVGGSIIGDKVFGEIERKTGWFNGLSDSLLQKDKIRAKDREISKIVEGKADEKEKPKENKKDKFKGVNKDIKKFNEMADKHANREVQKIIEKELIEKRTGNKKDDDKQSPASLGL